MKVTAITAAVHPGDEDKPYAEVVVNTTAGEVRFVIHESLCHSNAVNVEIDGDLAAGDPSLRVHLNDNLMFDTNDI